MRKTYRSILGGIGGFLIGWSLPMDIIHTLAFVRFSYTFRHGLEFLG
jgi:hypothetical protein